MKLEWKLLKSKNKKKNKDDELVAKLFKVVEGQEDDLVMNMYVTRFSYYTIPTHDYKFFKPTFIPTHIADEFAKSINKDFKDLSDDMKVLAILEAACKKVDDDLDAQLENIKKQLAS